MRGRLPESGTSGHRGWSAAKGCENPWRSHYRLVANFELSTSGFRAASAGWGGDALRVVQGPAGSAVGQAETGFGFRFPAPIGCARSSGAERRPKLCRAFTDYQARSQFGTGDRHTDWQVASRIVNMRDRCRAECIRAEPSVRKSRIRPRRENVECLPADPSLLS